MFGKLDVGMISVRPLVMLALAFLMAVPLAACSQWREIDHTEVNEGVRGAVAFSFSDEASGTGIRGSFFVCEDDLVVLSATFDIGSQDAYGILITLSDEYSVESMSFDYSVGEAPAAWGDHPFAACPKGDGGASIGGYDGIRIAWHPPGIDVPSGGGAGTLVARLRVIDQSSSGFSDNRSGLDANTVAFSIGEEYATYGFVDLGSDSISELNSADPAAVDADYETGYKDYGTRVYDGGAAKVRGYAPVRVSAWNTDQAALRDALECSIDEVSFTVDAFEEGGSAEDDPGLALRDLFVGRRDELEGIAECASVDGLSADEVRALSAELSAVVGEMNEKMGWDFFG